MQQPAIRYFDWVQPLSTQEASLAEIACQHWPQRFICPRCGHDHALSFRGNFRNKNMAFIS